MTVSPAPCGCILKFDTKEWRAEIVEFCGLHEPTTPKYEHWSF